MLSKRVFCRRMLILLIGSAPPVSAQQGGVSTAIAPDTFVRYTTPGQCEQAAIRLRREYWREKREDTVRYTPATDSVPASVAAAARTCAARFTPAMVSTRELRHLAQLYLWARQPVLAEATVRRLQEAEARKGPAEQGWTLYLLSQSFLQARPAQVAAAKQYLAQLDALGIPAAFWRLVAHTAAAQYALSVNDHVWAEQEGRAAIAAVRTSPSTDHQNWIPPTFAAYRVLARAVALHAMVVQGNPNAGKRAVLTVFDSAAPKLRTLLADNSSDQQQRYNPLAYDARPYLLLGNDTLSSLQAMAWYGFNHDTTLSAHQPRQRGATLLVFVDASCESRCYPLYATLGRLSAKYALPVEGGTSVSVPTSSPLNIILLASTRGYFRQVFLPDTKAEADSIGSYFLHFLKLRATVGVEATTFSRLADGRRRNEETLNRKAYYRERDAVLVDQHGTIQWVDDLVPQNEAVWDMLIGKVLRSRP